MNKQDYLSVPVEHLDIKVVNVVPLIDMMGKTAFQARNLARAAQIVDSMVADEKASVILTLAGSLISAGQKMAIVDLMRVNAIDAIVSTGANIVDQDFFEALGSRHYQGDIQAGDATLRDKAPRYPTRVEAMEGITGVGEKKRAEFGAIFAETIAAYLQTHSRIDFDD